MAVWTICIIPTWLHTSNYRMDTEESNYQTDTNEKGFTKDFFSLILQKQIKRVCLKYPNKPVDKKSTNHQFPYRKDSLLNLQILNKLSSCETVPLLFPVSRRLVPSLFICTWLLYSGLSSDPLLGHIQALPKPVCPFPLNRDMKKMKKVKYMSKLKKVNMSTKSGKGEKNELEVFSPFSPDICCCCHICEKGQIFAKIVGDF